MVMVVVVDEDDDDDDDDDGDGGGSCDNDDDDDDGVMMMMMMMMMMILCSISDNSVSLVLSATGTINILLLSFVSLPPNTHCPSTRRPRLHFRLPILLSSISMSTLGPPIFREVFIATSSHTSRAKFAQSTTVLLLTPTSCITYSCGSPWLQ